MFNKHSNTLEEHEKLVDNNRFLLTHIVIRRTKQLMKGLPVENSIKKVFNLSKNEDIPTHLMPKISLEEIRTGHLTWAAPEMPGKKI
jgi:DNA-directed RNA polymerase subunit K/omega